MATAAIGATYSAPSPLELHYPDSTSSIHPDRPIRPLPKRRLRSRVSSEVADSILYASEIISAKPLFQFPYNEPAKRNNGVTQDMPNCNTKSKEGDDGAGKDSYQFKGNDVGSDDEAVIMRSHQDQRQRPGAMIATTSRNGQTLIRTDPSRYIKPAVPQSTASSNESVDGYDSFENTNNKKKRKIPTSGSLGSHHASLSAELAHMRLTSARELDVAQAEADGGVGHYYGSGSSALPAVSSGNGLSGAGRGRYGRTATRHQSGRSPLGVSVNGSNALQAGRSLYHRNGYGPSGSAVLKEPAATQRSDQGIISAAIANAAALPSTPTRGQENTSLFEQQSSKKSSSAKTQFTFTCESDSAKGMVWSDQSPLARWDKDTSLDARSRILQNGRGFATQGTQTSPNIASQPGHNAAQQSDASQQPPQRPKKTRRPLAKQYAIAARDRRLRQEYSNYHHPPKEEDVWICQFCEYESLFGQPPQHLIRQYEAKDRRERKRLVEKRRLLDKAKMKGRKGKKGNKNFKNPNTVAQQQQQNQKQRHEQQPMDEVPMQDQGTQSEGYALEDYDEEPMPTPAFPSQTPTKIPQPVTQNHHHTLRPPFGSEAVRQGQAQDICREACF